MNFLIANKYFDSDHTYILIQGVVVLVICDARLPLFSSAMFSFIGLLTAESGSSFSLFANDIDLSFVKLLNGGFKVLVADFSSLKFKHY